MQAFTIFTMLFAAVSAQTACAPVASAVPTCAVPCIQSAASGVGCDNVNYKCRCANAAAIQNAALGCVLTNCGLTNALKAQASASAVCACVATAAPSV
ncbi:hypothetical protein GQ44DRAFT_825739 [Phaeosphaeriaceae sp. PMI808]|nr:hypothetical protein GQ44DRAFT_825739 [Phaeosphaeriaceae sp. PMI808]